MADEKWSVLDGCNELQDVINATLLMNERGQTMRAYIDGMVGQIRLMSTLERAFLMQVPAQSARVPFADQPLRRITRGESDITLVDAVSAARVDGIVERLKRLDFITHDGDVVTATARGVVAVFCIMNGAV